VDLPDFKEAEQFLAQGDDFLLTTHVNSDADGLGSCMALQGLLAHLGKKASIGLPDPPQGQVDFLEGWSQVCHVEQLKRSGFSCAIVLDCPSLERIGRVRDYLDAEARILNIDHHQGNERFGTINLVADTSSTCELIYHLASAAGYLLEPVTAAQLYTGILFDTGGFRFSLTTPTTFEVAADLARRGVRLDFIADQLFGNKTLEEVKQLGKAIESMELHLGGRVALMHLDQEALRQGDSDEVVNYGLLVKGVEVALLLKEQESGKYRVSLRSRNRVDVSGIAASFGGGGHARASGCRLEGTAAEVAEKLLAEIGKHL
jgi:phosphoesterase RecJ-like protein